MSSFKKEFEIYKFAKLSHDVASVFLEKMIQGNFLGESEVEYKRTSILARENKEKTYNEKVEAAINLSNALCESIHKVEGIT